MYGQKFCGLGQEGMGRTFAKHFVALLLLLPSLDCSAVRTEDHGDEKGIEKIQILGSVPLIPDRPQIQLSFFDWHGNITPTKLNGIFLPSENSITCL